MCVHACTPIYVLVQVSCPMMLSTIVLKNSLLTHTRVCVCVHMYVQVLAIVEEGPGCPRAGDTDICDLSDLDTGNRTMVLYKSSKCS